MQPGGYRRSSKDILTVPEDEILSAEVLYTIVGCDVRYEKSK